MTKLMEQAIQKLRSVPEDQQDELAGFLLSQIEEDERWQKSTAANAPKLQRFVDQILDADRRSQCPPLDPDAL